MAFAWLILEDLLPTRCGWDKKKKYSTLRKYNRIGCLENSCYDRRNSNHMLSNHDADERVHKLGFNEIERRNEKKNNFPNKWKPLQTWMTEDLYAISFYTLIVSAEVQVRQKAIAETLSNVISIDLMAQQQCNRELFWLPWLANKWRHRTILLANSLFFIEQFSLKLTWRRAHSLAARWHSTFYIVHKWIFDVSLKWYLV